MNTEIPQLKIERLDSGLIRLENTDCGESYSVDVHELHLRFMAEKLGLVREVSATDADMVRIVVKLKRRMLVLQKRVDHLASFLCLHSDSRHADLTYEQDYATATADICEEFCADLDEMPSRANPAETQWVTSADGTQVTASSRDVTQASAPGAEPREQMELTA